MPYYETLKNRKLIHNDPPYSATIGSQRIVSWLAVRLSPFFLLAEISLLVPDWLSLSLLRFDWWKISWTACVSQDIDVVLKDTPCNPLALYVKERNQSENQYCTFFITKLFLRVKTIDVAEPVAVDYNRLRVRINKILKNTNF